MSLTQTVDTAPIAPSLSMAGTQTDDVNPPAPALRKSGITTVETSPVTPVPTTADTQAVGTAPSAPVLCMSEITAVETTPTAPVRATLTPRKHPSMSDWFPHIIALLALLCAYLYLQVRAWSYCNTSTYGRSLYGAYGTPSYFLGVIPIGWNIGSTPFSENIAKFVAANFQRLEDWVEVNRTMPH
ncbi:uncharacterized protein BDR25DRAFT_304513 [Lindgomyces ingoldianus]|uniref:Uncharacterized protein n=1 Tax=Lindgomyces ingoldianus TaxID=673940 RepID=A0ACB6QRD9_9PLEO|nr:uncharacterized protein BDR25DRAFT_304513 [Lindgomyces ingoldianus]KAF2469427.1 hypothetical protein BDR25DRAFT_304513 [Lindgomyces ingoldianus]